MSSSGVWENKIFLNCSKKFIGICKKKQIWMPNKEYLRDHRGGRTNMAYKCKQFKTVNLTCYGHYTHVCRVSRVIGINTENKICLPNKEYISGHWWWRIKYVCQMHITHTYYCWAQSLMNYLVYFSLFFLS